MVTLTRLDCAVSSAALARFALAVALHHCRQRIVFGRPLIEQPLMRQMLADLALEVEAATALVFRLARAFDRQKEDATEQSFMRLMTPAIKYWVCKNLPGFAFEAMSASAAMAMSRTGRWRGSIARHRSTRSGRFGQYHVPGCPAGAAEQSRGAGTGARSVSARVERRARLLQPLIEPDSVSLRRDIERLVHLVAASLLARHARASWSMPMCGPASKAGRAAATASKGRRSTCSSIGRCPRP